MKAGDTVRYSVHLLRRWCRGRWYSAEVIQRAKTSRMTVLGFDRNAVVVLDRFGTKSHWASIDLSVVESDQKDRRES